MYFSNRYFLGDALRTASLNALTLIGMSYESKKNAIL